MQPLFKLLISGIFLNASLTCQGENFERVSKLIFSVKTKSALEGASMGHGTAFVVDKKGLLVTNYHVVSALFKNQKRDETKNLYIKVGNKQYTATLVRFDMFEDLALLRIPHTFGDRVTIKDGSLKPGQAIYALGFHNVNFLSINQGLFNDYMQGTTNQLMAISCPLNPGMSGGPLLNENLEVVGVNVLKTNKESDGYAINSNRLARFLKKDLGAEQTPASISAQIKATYKKLTTLVSLSNETRKLNRWTLVDFANVMACGEYSEETNPDEDKEDENENQIHEKYFICRLDYLKVPLSVFGSEVQFQYAVANFTGSKNTQTPYYYQHINKQFQFHSIKTVADLGEHQCRKLTLENSHGIVFRTSVCAFKHELTPSFIEKNDYYDFEIKAFTLNKSLDSLFIQLKFSGTSIVAKSLIKDVLNGVHVDSGESIAD